MIWMTPSFWYRQETQKQKFLTQVLAPVGRFYAWVVRQRFDLHYPVPLSRPVVCVGNLVAGGSGKTPVVAALVSLLQDRGLNPHILTRGYGGREEGPLQVSVSRDTAADVGDEALILSDAAPVWVSRNRPLGAQSAIDTGADIIIMDDGFQNPTIYKNFSLLVIDGASGFGNGQIFPAGPLREKIADGIARADAVVIIGEDKTGLRASFAVEKPDMPVFSAVLKAKEGNPDLFGKSVFAFAGIGRPEKFRDTLMAAGAMLEGWSEFPDHYLYVEDDLKELMDAATQKNALVITTAKDHVRLPEAYRARTLVYGVTLQWQDAAAIADLIVSKVSGR